MALPSFLPVAMVATALATTLSTQPPGGGRGFGREPVELVERFDSNENGQLERAERDAARAWLAENQDERRGRRFGRRNPDAEPPGPGPKVVAADVATYPDRSLYDTEVLRTFFFEFEHDDWEGELTAFYRSDVEVPADLLVDGKRLSQVGVRFRGNTSFMMVGPGRKKSLNLTIDFADPKQSLYGYETLNLLNCHADPSFLREVLHAYLGRQFAAVPQANLVHVVINGESWGVFANVQQVNRDYTKDAVGTRGGARWRVPPDFRGNGGLSYLGDERAEYERFYRPKGKVSNKAWDRLIELCRVLNTTEVDERRELLPALLHIDDALWFLAIDNVLVDGDGYLTRASDYALYLDPTGVFHPVTHDNNEILGGSPGRGRRPRGGPPGGPGNGRSPGDPGRRGSGRRRGGPGGPGGHRVNVDQSPLAGSDDENRPLLHRLLEVPEWRARYLAHVRSLAAALDWQLLGPEVQRLHDMIAPITTSDTHKIYDDDAFAGSVETLRVATEKRREALFAHEAIAGSWPQVTSLDVEAVEGDGRRLRFAARVATDVQVAEAWLHVQARRPGPFTTIAMQRDTTGAFQATIPTTGDGKRIRYYVAIRAAGDAGRRAFSPAGAASHPALYTFER